MLEAAAYVPPPAPHPAPPQFVEFLVKSEQVAPDAAQWQRPMIARQFVDRRWSMTSNLLEGAYQKCLDEQERKLVDFLGNRRLRHRRLRHEAPPVPNLVPR